MINTHKLELPQSRIYFHSSIGVRAIEVLLYNYTRVLDNRFSQFHMFFYKIATYNDKYYGPVSIKENKFSSIGLLVIISCDPLTGQLPFLRDF